MRAYRPGKPDEGIDGNTLLVADDYGNVLCVFQTTFRGTVITQLGDQGYEELLAQLSQDIPEVRVISPKNMRGPLKR